MDRRGFNRRVLLGGAAVATSLSIAPETAGAAGDAKGVTARTAPAGGEVRHIKMYARSCPTARWATAWRRARRPFPAR